MTRRGYVEGKAKTTFHLDRELLQRLDIMKDIENEKSRNQLVKKILEEKIENYEKKDKVEKIMEIRDI